MSSFLFSSTNPPKYSCSFILYKSSTAGILCFNTTLIKFDEKSINSCVLATKSVSQFISAIAAILESVKAAITPYLATLPDLFSAYANPYSLSLTRAFSISPFEDSNAFLHSFIGEPEMSLNYLISCAEMLNLLIN